MLGLFRSKAEPKMTRPKVSLSFLLGWSSDDREYDLNKLYAPTYRDENGRYVFGQLQWAVIEAFNIFQSVTPPEYWTWTYEERILWERKLSKILVKEIGEPVVSLGPPPRVGLDVEVEAVHAA